MAQDTQQAKGSVDRQLIDLFDREVGQGTRLFEAYGRLAVIVGIPFVDEGHLLQAVVRTAQAGLEQAGLANQSAVLVVGPAGREADLDAVTAPAGAPPVFGFLLDRELQGRGWGIRALLESASRKGSALLIIPPELIPQSDGADEAAGGFAPSWILRMLRPVQENEQDLCLARYKRFPMANVVESLLAYPIMSGVFGIQLRQPTPGIYAMSHNAICACVADTEVWPSQTGAFGVEPWIVARIVTEGLSICEVPLGTAAFHHDVGRLKLVFRQVMHSMLDQVDRHSSWWLDRIEPLATPLVSGSNIEMPPMSFELEPDELIRRFKLEFDHFDDTLFREIVPDELRSRMEQMADSGADHVGITMVEWIKVLREFVLAHKFETRFHPDDIVDGLFPFFLARLSTFIDEVRSLEKVINAGEGAIDSDIAKILVRQGAELIVEKQAHLFIDNWGAFKRTWRERMTAQAPYLPRLCAWEFVPHVEVMLPQELRDVHGNPVLAAEVYQKLLDRYREEFTRFISARLGIDRVTDSAEVLGRLRRFMSQVNWTLDMDVFPFDLTGAAGARKMVERVFERSAPNETFQLTSESARLILKRTSPRRLIGRLGCKSLSELLERFDPLDALGMAAWTDKEEYLKRVLDVIGSDATPEWFHMAPLKPVIVDPEYSSRAVELRGTSALCRLAGRLVTGSLPKGGKGEFPTLWFYLKLLKSIVGSEAFSAHWQRFARSSPEFGDRMVASIRGHWGRLVLSGHNAFENQQQREVVRRIRTFADDLAEESPNRRNAADLLRAMADVYHLSITLPDATFVPLSAWTWASYSARGGLGVPTPLSSLVERDWATRDFLTEYLTRTGRGDSDTIDKKIAALIGKGRESDSLDEHLFGVETEAEDLIITQTRYASPPLARKLERPVVGPILEPVPEHPWESRYVLNAAAVRLNGTIHILYRAFGEDHISRVGLAWTQDGVHIDGRLDAPVFGPEGLDTEKGGCEDPRVIVVEDRLVMLYTAYDGRLPQIAMASIGIDEFLERHFDRWERHGLGFPGLSNKDAVLYPKRFKGRYVVYHRIDPNMYISYLDDLSCPWPRTGQKIVVGPRPGMMWDGIKIGAGAQPIETTHGWLNIYHGVDYEHTYRLGVLFMDKRDPSKVIYRSPNPVLEPAYDFEIGRTQGGDFWVPRVVFTCGAVPAADREVVGPDDEILVYYGAADTAIGVAKGRLRDLVPTLPDNNTQG